MPVKKQAKRKTYKNARSSQFQVMGGTGILKSILKFAKKHKLISKGLNVASGVLPPGFSQAAKVGSFGARLGGYGNKKRVRGPKKPKPRTGSGISRAGAGLRSAGAGAKRPAKRAGGGCKFRPAGKKGKKKVFP